MNKIKIDPNIELRQVDPSNVTSFLKLIDANRSYLREWLGWLDSTRTEEDLLKFINSTLILIKEKKALCYLIWNCENIVGIIHLRDIDLQNKKGMIGYWVGQEFRGRGFAKLATQAVTTFAMKELKLNRIEIRCALGNIASQAIPRHLGFKEEGLLRDNEWLYDHFVDHVVFSTIASEWMILNNITEF